MYLILDLSAAPHFNLCLKQAPFSLPLSQLFSYWLLFTNRRIEWQVGGASVLTSRAGCFVNPK